MRSFCKIFLLAVLSFPLMGMETIIPSDEQLMELDDSVLRDLQNRCKKILEIRIKNKRENRFEIWNQFLKENFPESQMGGKLEIIDYYRVNLDFADNSFTFIFTPNNKLTFTTNEAPYRIDFNNFWGNVYELRFDFNGHSSCTSTSRLYYTYKNADYSNQITNGELTPYACNQGRCEKHLPPEILSLPWVSKLIHCYKEVYETLTKMENPRTNSDYLE